MALGVLGIIAVVTMIAGLALQILLYIGKYRNNSLIFILNVVLALIVAYMSFTALASNFIAQKVLAVGLGILSLLAAVLRVQTTGSHMMSKIMLSISVVGGIIQLFLV